MAESEAWLKDIAFLIWLDTDLLTGDGIILETAPECFVLGEDGLEHVACGKIVSWEGGPEALMPTAKAFADKLIQTAEEMPAQALFLETPDPDQDPEELWQTFFSANLQSLRDRLEAHGEKVKVKDASLDLRYAASLIIPDASLNMGNSTHAEFDVLGYLKRPGSAKLDARKKLAGEVVKLTKSAASDALGKHARVLKEILGYL